MIKFDLLPADGQFLVHGFDQLIEHMGRGDSLALNIA